MVTFEWVKTFLNDVVTAFVDDTVLLDEMVHKMLVPIPTEIKDNIMDPKHKGMVTELLKNPQYKPTINGTNLMAQWRQWLKQIGQDGGTEICSLAFRVHKFSETITALRDLTNLTDSLNTIVKTLPEISNIHQRKAAALAFLNKTKGRKDWAAGPSVLAALTALSQGKAADEPKAADKPAASSTPAA